MRFSTIAAFVTSLAVVSAQGTDLSSVPDCAVSCLVAAIPDSGCGVTDVACQCTTGRQALTSSLESCVPTSCSAADAAKVAPALVSICGAAGFSVAIPSSLATTSTAASAASSAAGSVTSAASSVAASTSSGAASAASSAPAQSTGGAAANVAGLGAVALGMFAAIL